MSDKSKLVKTIVDNTIEKRRDLQFEEMKRWDSGKITGIEAIENILQIEKLIFFNMKESKDELRGKKDG